MEGNILRGTAAAELLVANLKKVEEASHELSDMEAVYTAGRLDGLLDALGLKKVGA